MRDKPHRSRIARTAELTQSGLLGETSSGCAVTRRLCICVVPYESGRGGCQGQEKMICYLRL